MAETRKVLGQAALSATTLTDIYTVPALTQAVISSVIICNRSASAAIFRVSLAVAGAADVSKQYIYYDVTLPGNDTFIATVGITLGAADVLRAYTDSGSVSINVVGVELT